MTCVTWAAPLRARLAIVGRIPSSSAASATSSGEPRPRSRRFSPNNPRRRSKSIFRSPLFPPLWGRVGWGLSLQFPADDPPTDPFLEEAFFDDVGALGLQGDQSAGDQRLDGPLDRCRRAEVRAPAVILAVDVATPPLDQCHQEIALGRR